MTDIASIIAAIKEREAKAKPGPWKFHEEGAPVQTYAVSRADGEFIAASRSDVPRLVKALEYALMWMDATGKENVLAYLKGGDPLK